MFNINKRLKQWVKDYDEMLLQVMNKHGVPINRENLDDFIGKLEICEYQEPASNEQIVVIYYERKEVARLKKWLEWKDENDTLWVTQHIEEIPTEDTKLELKGNNTDQLLVDEGV